MEEEIREKANQVERLALDRGYWLHNRTGDYKKLNFIRNDGNLGLIVHTETGDFELYHNINKSIARISLPKCSPFSNEGHFKKMESQLWKFVSVILDSPL
jgi:hypothetical protein